MFEVKNKCCNQCLFSKNKIVSDKRKEELLENIWDTWHFICHKATIEWKDICCKWFYDNVKNQKIRMAERLWIVDLVD